MSDLWTWGAKPKKKARQPKPNGPLPPIPNTGWTAPETFPDLSGAKMICVDVETYDPNLMDKGPGFVRGESYIIGVAIGTDDGFRGYYPIRHTLGGNLNPDTVFGWLQRELGRDNQIKINQNILYDLEALEYEGVTVKGPLYDIAIAEALLDEMRFSYSLNAIAKTHLGEQKDEGALYEWCARAYGGKPNRRQIANAYRAPTALVGPYAEMDVDLPLRVFKEQKEKLWRDGLWDLFDMECRLLPMLLKMRLTGVRINLSAAEELKASMQTDMLALERAIEKEAGFHVDIWAAASLARAFDNLGLGYPRTAKTKAPSFTKDFLSSHQHPIAQKVKSLREQEKFLGTFVQGYILDNQVNGRVHGQFHPMKSDDGGTVTGRFSSSLPNLQNIPSRDEKYGPLIRALFIPEDGHEWCCADYSQIEPRILIHYAVELGMAEELCRAYKQNKASDFYGFVMELCSVSRPISKGLSLGMMYAMGKKKLARSLGLDEAAAEPLFDRYHKELPFIGELMEKTTSVARTRGYVKTILGRRARFPLYEKAGWDEDSVALPHDEALEAYGPKIVRAFCYKALNRIIQGSAADVFKKAMVYCFEDGLFDKAPVHLFVHDEVDYSVPIGDIELPKRVAEHMETALPLNIPLSVDYKVAADWGGAK